MHPVPRAIGVLTAVSQRYCLLTLVLATLLAAAGARYTVTHVGISTDTQNMLSDRLPWRVAYRDFKAAFPFFADTIVVVVDAATADLAREAADRLAARLASADPAVGEVFHPGGQAFFRRHQFLYLEEDELQALADALGAAQPFLARLAAQPGLDGYLALLEEAAEARDLAPELRLAPVFEATAQALSALLEGDDTPMSWQALVLGEELGAQTRVLFTVQPELDFGSMLPGADAMAAIRAAARDLGYGDGGAVNVRLTGSVALSYDELDSVVRGAEQAAVLAFVMVAVVLVLGVRSLALVVAVLVTLVIGLVYTATFAVFAVGTLNMISVAFAVLYVGLGVDFAIHVALRYRELARELDKSEAITTAARHIGTSIVLCAGTTALAFFAFIPTAYRGVAELGLISGVGMFIGAACSFTVLPALLEVLPRPRLRLVRGELRLRTFEFPQRRAGAVLVVAAMLAVAAALALPRASFDLNPIHLNDPTAESVRTFMDLGGDADEGLYTIEFVADGKAQMEDMAMRIASSPLVHDVVTVRDLVPTGQEAKLAILADLAFLLGSDLEPGVASAPVPAAIDGRLASLAASLAPLANADDERLASAAGALRRAVERTRARLEAADPAAAQAWVAALEHKLMHHFEPQIAALAAGLDAGAVDRDALPDDLERRWVTGDERYRLEIRPAGDMDDNDALATFVDAVRAETGPGATGTPVINLEASRAVTKAFYQAIVSALALIAVVLFYVLRRAAEVAIVMTPLVLAALLTSAVMVVSGYAFNFANIIALPLLMGIGVDSALHLLHRFKTLGLDDGPLLGTSTARAVLFSALTTIASFGNLAVSPHAGTASMGVVLTIGLAMTLLCTLVVLPALLARYVEARREIA